MQQSRERDLVKDFIFLRNFVSKFATGVKLNDNRFDKTDFVEMMQQFPEAYKNANYIYKNVKAEKIVPMILATVMNDGKQTGTNSILTETYKYITSGQLQQEAETFIEPLSKQKIEGDLDCIHQTAIYLSLTLIKLADIFLNFKPQIEVIQQESQINENYYLMDLFAEDYSGYEDLREKYGDGDLLTILQKLITDAVLKTQVIIKKKQFIEEIQKQFPSSYCISSLVIALGMIYSQVLFI